MVVGLDEVLVTDDGVVVKGSGPETWVVDVKISEFVDVEVVIVVEGTLMVKTLNV